MLAGLILASILAGTPSLALSVAAGHPPLFSLMAYSLAGCCGVLLFALRSARVTASHG